MLLDACAIFSAVEQGKLSFVTAQATSPLAEYELGNALWKKAVLGRVISVQESLDAMALFHDVLHQMKKVRAEAKAALGSAASAEVSFYDASYLQAAIVMDIPLVTDDTKFFRKAGKFVRVLTLAQALASNK
ncbi:MAG: type II toxin-antitoxin system VapC family toxin [Candidatus Omnitrophica bacterium]|nr:type II toxin-antitoxin system VapC family toxin [Candidatus Omnitrophota bacterium]